MRLIDLVIQSIKETIRNDDVNFNVDSYLDGSLEINPEYQIEINNVLLSINKAISRFVTNDKLEYKHIVLIGEKDIETYDLSSYNDIKNIKSVFIVRNNKTQFLGWQQFGKNSIYLGYGIDTNIHIIYQPKIKNFTLNDIYQTTTNELGEIRVAVEDDLEEVYGITDEMCNYISYFAKSELYENRDADRCKRYLNYFEQFLQEIKIDRTYPHQESIRSPYKIR